MARGIAVHHGGLLPIIKEVICLVLLVHMPSGINWKNRLWKYYLLVVWSKYYLLPKHLPWQVILFDYSLSSVFLIATATIGSEYAG